MQTEADLILAGADANLHRHAQVVVGWLLLAALDLARPCGTREDEIYFAEGCRGKVGW